ncbi:MAG TPA: hypothetical protein VKP67_26040 [Xanthobacteraceae bacterium]|nr:hypothetical protein [Xanthobacteraceae bacterium]
MESKQPPGPDASEAVNHPAHYGGADNPYEAIKVIEAWGLNFHLGNKEMVDSGEAIKGALMKAKWIVLTLAAALLSGAVIYVETHTAIRVTAPCRTNPPGEVVCPPPYRP